MISIEAIPTRAQACDAGPGGQPCKRFAVVKIGGNVFCKPCGIQQLNVLHTLAIERVHHVTAPSPSDQNLAMMLLPGVMGGDREF